VAFQDGRHDGCSERAACEIVVVEFLNAAHPNTDPNLCAWCGRPETQSNILLPIGVPIRKS
jgi:hypothetical protein